MGDMANDALDQLADEDELQLDVLGYSNVYGKGAKELSEAERWRMEEGGDINGRGAKER